MVPNNCSFQTGVTSGRIFGLSLAPRLDGPPWRGVSSPHLSVHPASQAFLECKQILHGKGPTNPLGCLSIQLR